MDDDRDLALFLLLTPFFAAVIILAIVSSGSLDLITSAAGILFAVIAALQLSGRGAQFTAGYNSMTREEKSAYSGKKIARGSGIAMAGCAVLFATVAKGMPLTAAGAITFAVLLVAGFVYMVKFAKI